MYIILTYDVKKKENKKILKICRKYLSDVLESVFEGEITEANYKKLKYEISKVIDPNNSSVCVFKSRNINNIEKEQLGISNIKSNII